MKLLEIIRTVNSKNSCIGDWILEGKSLHLFSLEDYDRGLNNLMPLGIVKTIKIQDETAIPTGEYDLVVDRSERWSNKYGYDFYMLHVKDVKGYLGIRIHWGNVNIDTDGCPLVGKSKKKDTVLESREGYKILLDTLAPIMGFTTRYDAKNRITKIVLPEGWIQKEQVRIKISRTYEINI